MAAQVKLTVQNGKHAGRQFLFTAPCVCVIGRGEDCAIQLADDPEFDSVSRHHCLLEIDPPRARVRDCGSFNGTRLNGAQIGCPAWGASRHPGSAFPPSYSLTNGDELKVGHTRFRVSTNVPLDVGVLLVPPEDSRPSAPTMAADATSVPALLGF